jgi:hypothetical protein
MAIQYFILVLDQNSQTFHKTEEGPQQNKTLRNWWRWVPLVYGYKITQTHDNYSLDPLFLDEESAP